MNGLKRLTEQDYGKLTSVRKRVFNMSDEGKLNPFEYECLSSMVSEREQEYNVSEFERFLKDHRAVYEMRREEG